jgi:hypothetical protein
VVVLHVVAAALVGLVACSGPDPEPPDTGSTEPEQPPVSATGVVDITGAIARRVDGYGSVLRVSWTQSDAASVRVLFEVDPGEWRASPQRALEAGDHEELILGVPYDADVNWRIEATTPDGETVTPYVVTRTGPLDIDVRVPWVTLSDPSGWDAEMGYVLVSVSYDDTFFGEHAATLIDRRGRVVWAQRSDRNMAMLHPRVSWDGTSFLLDNSAFWGGVPGNAERGYVTEVKIDGSVVRTVDMPGLYHAFTDLPDGTLAYPRHWSTDWDAEAGADGEVVVLVHPDGTETDLFDCGAWLQGRADASARCGANTLSYDAERDRYLYSLFTIETVIELDGTTGQPNRWFGHLDGAWSFGPPDSAFWYQHGPIYLPDGHMLVSTHRAEDDTELVVREYELDEAGEALVEVWSFGEGEGEIGRQMGEAHRLAGGNTLHNFGTHAVLREVTRDGQVVWDVRWESEQYGIGGSSTGRSAPVSADLYRFAPPRK